MKALLAVLAILIAVALVVAAYWFISAPKPVPPGPPVTPVTPRRAAAPAQVVRTYLEALNQKNYGTAYDLISADSRRAHSFDEFVKLSEEKGVTQYDLTTAREEVGKGGVAVVTISLKEDPAQAGFHLVQERGQWRIEFFSGIPSFPYPKAE